MFNYRKVSIAAGVVWAVLAVGSVASAGAEFAAFTDSEKEEFLRTAKVVVRRGVGVGINNTEKVTLTGDGVTHDAHLQTVNIHKTSYRTNEGLELNFRDGYQFNVAAYKLDRLLGLNMVPVSIERKIAGTAGSLTWWVDDVLMMERDRYQKKMRVPPLKNAAWNDQMFQIRIFNELIYNTDANLGNILITKDWDVRIIDFSRAFRVHNKLRAPENLRRCDPRVLKGLRDLNMEVLQREMKGLLTKTEMKALLARRDKIVDFFEREIAAKGEEAVVCNRPGH